MRQRIEVATGALLLSLGVFAAGTVVGYMLGEDIAHALRGMGMR